MRKRILTLVSLSIPTLKPAFLPHISRQNPLRFISTDNLDGLVGPDDPADPLDSRQVELVSIEEFAFLRDSLLTTNTDKQIIDTKGTYLNDAVLITNTILNYKGVFDKETEKFLRQYRGKLNESLVSEVLCGLSKKPELGVRFFIWAGRQVGYSHTMPVYDALIELLRRSYGGDDGSEVKMIPENFLLEIKDDDKEVLGKLLNLVVRKCCRNGLWNLALEELGRLKEFGYKPSRATYNALVQVFLRAEQLDTAYLVHREMLALGYRMDGFTLGCFVYELCKAGKWREALGLIEKEEFKLDTVLYTKMISGLCEATLFEEAMDFLHRMRASSCLPNAVTYRILLCGCLRKRQLGRCKRILKMMISEGCFPSLRIFNSLVHSYCVARDYSYAHKLLKKMRECGLQPGYVVYNILIGGICGNEELPSMDALELAENAYSEMLEAGIVLNKINVCNFSRCLCDIGKYEKAYSVIREMMTKGFVPDTSTYSKVIGYLCNASKVEKAFQLFEEMKKNGMTPDVYTYTTLIDNFCKVGLIDQARRWFDEMERDGCLANVVTYTALIHAYLKARKLADANEVFDMMLSKGCIPNVVTFTALIDGYCKAGESEKACHIYAKMKKDTVNIPEIDMYFKVVDSESREPNVITYGALIDGLCKTHKVKEAYNLLEAMITEGCKPNNIVYDALIDGFCKAGKLDEAQEVFTKMLGCGYNANVYTYSSLIDRLFKDKRLDLALKVLSKMLENSCPPNVVIYTEMIDGLCKAGKTDEAHKLMLLMEEKGCNPNVVTYTAMIDGYGNVGRVDRCLELFQQMGSKGCAPNFITYRVLISHCSAAALLDEAHKLLEEMKQTYWPRHVTGYRKVIEGFSHEFLGSLGLLDEISGYSTPLVSPVYKMMIDNSIKAGRLEKALELYEELLSEAPIPTDYQYLCDTLIESFSHAGKIEKAFELYADMISRGNAPELKTLVHLVKGLFRVNRWEEALQLLQSICQMDIIWVQKEH